MKAPRVETMAHLLLIKHYSPPNGWCRQEDKRIPKSSLYRLHKQGLIQHHAKSPLELLRCERRYELSAAGEQLLRSNPNMSIRLE